MFFYSNFIIYRMYGGSFPAEFPQNVREIAITFVI